VLRSKPPSKHRNLAKFCELDRGSASSSKLHELQTNGCRSPQKEVIAGVVEEESVES
jgi:hypothetical protein